MPLMVRHADNDFFAILTANAMEDAGAVVISIAYNGQHKPFGAMEPSSRFVVFARIRDNGHIDAIDTAISAALDNAGL